MYRFTLVTLIILAYLCGCAHIKKDAQLAPLSSAVEVKPPHVFCSEANSDAHHLQLTVNLKNVNSKKWTLHKQLDIPHFKREGGFFPMGISRELLIWRDDRIVLAEVLPTETTDLFMLYVTSFERSKHGKLTSTAYVVLRLCQDAEMTIGGDKELHSLKARLELVGEPSKK